MINYLFYRICQNDGSWNVSDLASFKCKKPDCPDMQMFSTDRLSEFESGVNIAQSGFNIGDVSNITCKEGYIKNTELAQVQVTCMNNSVWSGHWGLLFDNNATEVDTLLINHKLSNSSLQPKCYSAEPAFELLQDCQHGCQVGWCHARNQSDGYKCVCGDEHSGFHCKANVSKYSNKHVAAITIPLLMIVFGLGVWWYRRSRDDYAATALINEDADDSYSTHDAQSKLPWETDNNSKSNSKFPSIHKKNNDGSTLVRTTFKPVRGGIQ